MIESPSGRSPEKAPRWDLTGTEGCGGGKVVSWISWMFLDYKSIYRRKKYVGGAPSGPRGWGHALLPRGRLTDFQTSTPSFLDCVCSKKDPREVFVPFGIPFLRNTEIGKKTENGTGPPVNRLVPKII